MDTHCRFLFWLFFGILVQVTSSKVVSSIEVEEPRSLVSFENLLTGLILQPDGSLILLENDAGRISHLVLDSNKNLKKIERIAEDLIDPIAVVPLKNGDWIVAERKPGRILQISGNRKKFIADSLTDISSLRLDSEGNLWVTELNPGRLLQIDLNTGKQTVILEGLNFPSDVLPTKTGIVITEMVDYTGKYGKISYGEYAKTSSISFKLIQNWKSDDNLIDPLRLVPDPRNDDNVFVSVRTNRAMVNRLVPEGGILTFNKRTGTVEGEFAGALYGPTDMVAGRDGLYVIEELAERLSFIDWSGKRKIIWDGLGNPSSFSIDPQDPDTFYVAENIPEPLIYRIGKNLIESIEIPSLYRTENIGGILKLNEGSILVSFTGGGIILKLNTSSTASIFSSEIFAPAKMLSANDDSIYVLDPLFNQIIQLDDSTGQILREISGKSYILSDFDLDTDSGKNTLIYALDNRTGLKLYYSESLKRFVAFGKIDEPAKSSPVFAHIQGKGFLLALNNDEGALVWNEDQKESTLLTTQYKNVVQLQRDRNNRITVLSRNGWLRTFNLSLEKPIPTIIPVTPRPLEPSPMPKVTMKPTRLPTFNPTATTNPKIVPTSKQNSKTMLIYPFSPFETETDNPILFPTSSPSPTVTPSSTANLIAPATYTPTVTPTATSQEFFWILPTTIPLPQFPDSPDSD